jgi:hypothetical protein
MKAVIKVIAWSIVAAYFIRKHTYQVVRYVSYEAFKARSRVKATTNIKDEVERSLERNIRSGNQSSLGSLAGYMAIAGQAQARQSSLVSQQMAARQAQQIDYERMRVQRNAMSSQGYVSSASQSCYVSQLYGPER